MNKIIAVIFCSAILLMHSCASRKPLSARGTSEKNVQTASQIVSAGSTSKENSPKYRIEYKILRGAVFGVVGLIAVPYLTLRVFDPQVFEDDCQIDCVPPYIPYVAGFGLISGFIIGGRHRVKIKETKRNEQTRLPDGKETKSNQQRTLPQIPKDETKMIKYINTHRQ